MLQWLKGHLVVGSPSCWVAQSRKLRRKSREDHALCCEGVLAPWYGVYETWLPDFEAVLRQILGLMKFFSEKSSKLYSNNTFPQQNMHNKRCSLCVCTGACMHIICVWTTMFANMLLLVWVRVFMHASISGREKAYLKVQGKGNWKNWIDFIKIVTLSVHIYYNGSPISESQQKELLSHPLQHKWQDYTLFTCFFKVGKRWQKGPGLTNRTTIQTPNPYFSAWLLESISFLQQYLHQVAFRRLHWPCLDYKTMVCFIFNVKLLGPGSHHNLPCSMVSKS